MTSFLSLIAQQIDKSSSAPVVYLLMTNFEQIGIRFLATMDSSTGSVAYDVHICTVSDKFVL